MSLNLINKKSNNVKSKVKKNIKRILQDEQFHNIIDNLNNTTNNISTLNEIDIANTINNISSVPAVSDNYITIPTNIDNSKKLKIENNEIITHDNKIVKDIKSLFNEFRVSNPSNTITDGKSTTVDIVKIHAIDPTTNNPEGPLIAFALSNFFGGRDYISNTIQQPSKLMYSNYIEKLCSDKKKVKDESDVSYLFHQNNRPVTLISSLPQVENKFYLQTIDDTLKNLINTYEGKKDPANSNKTFTFKFLPSFTLDTIDKQMAFIYVINTMKLPERLTSAHETVMEYAMK